MNYIDFMKNGGIHIKEKNRGKFTASAKRAGRSVQEHADAVLKDPDATPLQKRRAQFAKNSKLFKHENGGVLFAQTGASVNLQYAENKKDSATYEDPLKTLDGQKKQESATEDNTTSTETATTNWWDQLADQYERQSEGSGNITSITSPTSTSESTGTVSANTGDPRGFRNNNWLNIRISDANWQGKKASNTDGAFEQFDTPELGIRAAARNIKTYASRGLNTIKDIISTWAPASDNNNTNSYITNVASRMGVNPNATIDVNNPEVMTKLIAAMTVSENGREGDIEVIKRGVAMA